MTRPTIRAALLALCGLASALGCSDPPAPGRGGEVSKAMGIPAPVVPISPTLPAPRVEYLGELAAAALVSPTRIAVTPGDEILVSDAAGGDVHRFSARGTPRGRITGFLRPLAVGAGPAGELYVGEAADGSVRIVDRTGRALGAFGKGAGELEMPNDLAVDRNTGEVFVSDSRRHQVRVFSASGTPLRTLLSRGAAPGQVSFPAGIALGEGGELLVADHDNVRIQAFSADGVLRLPVIGGTLSAAPGGLVRPQGIARDALGRIYVADAWRGTVQVFDPNGAHLSFVGVAGQGAGELALPSDVVVDRFGRLLVASHDTGKVLVYGLDDWVMPPSDALSAEVVIEPGTLAPASRGRSVTAYVELPGRDPSDLVGADAILRVEGKEVAAEPRTRSPGDHDADGVVDVAFKFPRQALASALGAPGAHQVAFAARLATGEAVEGTTVLILAARRDEP